jgi:hypothetical protein
MSLLPRIAYAVAAAGVDAVRTRSARAWRRVRALPTRRRPVRPARVDAPTLAATTLAAVLLTTAASCGGGAVRGRYLPRPGLLIGSHAVNYGWDRVAERWVQRECEWRVPAGRRLPGAVELPGGGASASLARHDPEGVESGALGVPVARDGYRVWARRDVVREDDLRGRTSYAITLREARAADAPPSEVTDVFPIPAPGDTPPDAWTPWSAPTHRRTGAFGWWEEAHGAPRPAPTPEAHPIEMRCRWYHAADPVRVE